MNTTTLRRLSGFVAILAISTACTSKQQADDKTVSMTAPPSPAAAEDIREPSRLPDVGAQERDPSKAVERHLSEIKRLVPGMQGLYVDSVDGSIVLDVHVSTGDATDALEAKRSAAERLLGHPVRINRLASPIVQQQQPTTASEK